jgi:hypothetical protein
MKVILSPQAYALKNTGITYTVLAVQLVGEVPKKTLAFK